MVSEKIGVHGFNLFFLTEKKSLVGTVVIRGQIYSMGDTTTSTRIMPESSVIFNIHCRHKRVPRSGAHEQLC
jgi:hypothetical protein